MAPIGAGGMGQVWKATDPRLGRTVAVKVLPEGSADDLRVRFEQEARAASALQHPHIVAVYDVGEAAGVSYIVSELVEGETLRAVINRGALPLRRTLEIAAHIADGLAAAHHLGITHRDLKPENVMIAADGRAKILDFGLAKRATLPSTSIGDNSTETYHSEAGVISGTANYMSPEQARGLAIDPRSDQFSLGIILHELLTGRQPFRRESYPQTLAAIIADDAPPLPPSVPAPLRWVIDRCLEKEPGRRFGSTADLFRDLRQMREHLTDLSVQAVTPPPRRSRAFSLLFLAGACMLTGALLLTMARGALEVDPVALVPFATEPETENFPTFSPDGESIAYWKSPNQIWVRGVGNPNAVMIAEEANGRPIWSRDGSRVCYRKGRELWCVSPTGGTPKRLLADGGVGAQFTPDGKGLLLYRPNNTGAPRFYLSSPPGREPTPLPAIDAPPRIDSLFAFSPDGTKLMAHSFTQELWIVPYPAGKAHRLEYAKGGAFDWFPDSRHGVVSAEREGFQAMYLIDTQSPSQRLLLRGSTQLAAASMSPDGSRIVYSTGLADWDAMEYGIDGKFRRALVASTSRELYSTWSPTEERFAYVSYAGRNPSIWTRAADGSAPVLLREVPDIPVGPSAPAYSPDGRRIAYWVPQEIEVIPAGGGQHVAVAKVRSHTNDICWSADGETIWYTQPGQLMKVSAQGGEPVMVRETRGFQLACSPDGKWIAYTNEKGLHLMSPDGKQDRVLFPGPIVPSRIQFGDGGKLLYQLEFESKELITWDVESGKRLRSVEFLLPPGDILNRFHVHPDGRRVLVQQGRISYDLWFAEGFARPSPVWRRWLQHWEVPRRALPSLPEPE